MNLFKLKLAPPLYQTSLMDDNQNKAIDLYVSGYPSRPDLTGFRTGLPLFRLATFTSEERKPGLHTNFKNAPTSLHLQENLLY